MSGKRGAAPWVLGISASHNGAYCLLHGSEIRVAIQEERLTGRKRARVSGAGRGLGLRYCLDTAGIRAADLSLVVLACQRSATAAENDIWLNPDLSGARDLQRRIVPHHLAHAASTMALSGYGSAAVLVADGLGSPIDELSAEARRVVIGPTSGASEHLSLFRAKQSRLTPLEIHSTGNWLEKDPRGMWRFFSLGGMYSAVAQQIFGDPMEAGKVMGLAPYGEPRIPIDEFLAFVDHEIRFPNIVQRRFPHHDRWPAHQRHYQDLAASVQQALEVALLRVISRLRDLTGETRLCLAGGVALNGLANQRICCESGFADVFIIPAAEDSGVAIGAAYLGLWELGHHPPHQRSRRDAYGRTSHASEIAAAVQQMPDVIARRSGDVVGEAAARLAAGQIGGWFQGGSELGPRALGQRSIVCSPCARETKPRLNQRVKFREAFRPFAPAVLAERAGEWFDFGSTPSDSPFMLRVVPFRQEHRARVPAVVHVDGSGRVQTLTREENGPFYELVARFFGCTGIPLLLNTSLNIQGEPIVETPLDALWCLLGTGLDFCVIHDWIVTRAANFRTILDYVPAAVAAGYTLRLEIRDHALQRQITSDDAVVVQTTTPWGACDQVVPPRLLPLLLAIDGRRDGHALLKSLPGDPSAQPVIRDLLLLRRMHVIQLSHVANLDRRNPPVSLAEAARTAPGAAREIAV